MGLIQQRRQTSEIYYGLALNPYGGNVGIGTTAPAKKLHVLNSTNEAQIRLGQSGSGSYDMGVYSGDTFSIGRDADTREFTLSGGNVGIGVTSPAEKLEVLGNIRLNTVGNQLEFSNANVALQRGASNVLELGGYGGIAFKASAAAIDSQTERMRITDAGNVGIGTTSPSRRFQVKGTENTAIAVTSATTSYVQLALGDTDDDNYAQIILDNPTNKLQIQNGGGGVVSDRGITLDSSENVGIGTASPGALLDIKSSTSPVLRISNGGGTSPNPKLEFYRQAGVTANVRYDVANKVFILDNEHASGIIDFKVVNSSKMRIDSSGNVGIGTTSPSYKLDVSGGDINLDSGKYIRFGDELSIKKVSNGAMHFYPGTNSTTGGFDFATWNGSGYNEGAFVIRNSGNVGIGTTSPSAKLHIDDYTMANTDYDSLAAQIIQSKEGRLQFVAEDDGNDAGYLIMTNVPASGDNKHWIIGQRGPIRNNNFEIGYKTSSAGGNIAQGDFADFVIDTTGNVGIGTTSPTEKLTVSGNISVSGDVYSDGSIHADEIKGRTYPTYNILSLEDDNLPNQNGVSLSSVGSMAFHLDVNNNSSNDSFDWKADAPTSGSATSLMRLTDEGNLGIGTTSPSAKLDVAGLANINDGSSNVMISSGNTAMTGAYNTAVGYQAGLSNTSGSYNAFFGRYAGYYNTSGGSNSFIGVSAGQSNTIGNSNSFVGVNAGYSNTNGGDNSFVGVSAGFSNTSGSYNSFVGRNAGQNNTIGNTNSFFGRNTGYYSTGSANVLIGYEAGYGSATSAYSNTVAVGYQALYDLTTGVNNTAVGYQAARTVSTANNNTAIGYVALDNTNTSYNTAVGAYCLKQNALGERNTAVGWYAAHDSTGSYNASLGMRAGRYGSNSNTAVGYDAASTTTGSNNVAIGRSAGQTNSTGSGNIFIGCQAGYYETGSNKLYIANTDTTTPLIYGEFDNEILNVNGKLKPNSITVDDEGLSAAGDYGAGAEIWYQGTSTPLAGSCYYLDSTGGWTSAQADAAGTATGMLAISAGTDSDVDGMVLRGFVQIGNALTGASVGDAVYLSESFAGKLTTTKPTTPGDFVRRVGYLAKGTNVIYFNPSPEWEAL